MLAAINTAARQLNTRPETDIKEIVILGTGLSTTGFLNFTEGDSRWLYSNPEEIIAILRGTNNIPDLTGITVIWGNMHDVGGEQMALDGTRMQNLEGIWRMIIESGGGTFEISSVNAGSGIYGDDFPIVSVVNLRPQPISISVSPTFISIDKGEVYIFEAIVSGINNPSQDVTWSISGNFDDNTGITNEGELFVASEEISTTLTVIATSVTDFTISGNASVSIKGGFIPPPPEPKPLPPPQVINVNFRPDSAIFINEVQAIRDIEEWVDFIKTQDRGIYLFGCTAKIDGVDNEMYDACVNLGQARAEAVKNLFIEHYGIEPNRIITKGLGYDNPWHINNGVSGVSWNEVIAAQNRRVVIMYIGDEIADKVYIR
jgi:hypothetical protein